MDGFLRLLKDATSHIHAAFLLETPKGGLIAGLVVVIAVLPLVNFFILNNGSKPSMREKPKALPPTNLPVLIIGAGPTGLTLASVLVRYGIPIRIIEKRSHLSPHSRAANLMQRNQELMLALGLLDEIQAAGGQMRRLMVHAYGKCFGPRTMRLAESPCTDVILCGQQNFEGILCNDLLSRQVRIEFEKEFLSVEGQDETSISVRIAHKSGIEDAKFSYIVGCDGRMGITRKHTCHDFEPTKTGVVLRQVDCTLSWNRLGNSDQMWLFYYDHGFAAIIPLPGKLHRILFVGPSVEMPLRDPTLPEMEAKLRDIAADPSVQLNNLVWASYTELSMGLATGLRDGRIFLAGDAGNPVLPNGGQGMNTGIADGFNLGWKLAAACAYGGSDQLLDTYNEERHAVRTALQAAQFNSLKYTTLVTPKLMQKLFRIFAEPALNWGGEYKLAQAFSELTIDTRNSKLTLDKFRSGGLYAGSRALDAMVVHGKSDIKIYDLIYRGSWTLIAFSGCGSRAESAKVLDAITALNKPDLASFLITTESAVEDGACVCYDLDEEAHRVYHTSTPAMYLVRPDGHIAVRMKPEDIADMVEYLDYWVPDSNQILK